MKTRIIVLFALFCSFTLFHQCSTIEAGKITHVKKTVNIEQALIISKQDSLQLYKDSILHYKELIQKLTNKIYIVSKKDSVSIEGKTAIDSAEFHLYKDSLQVEKGKNKLLRDSLGFEKAKLLDASLKSDTLILKTKQLFEAKILSLQKNNQPKILYKLIPYEVVKKDLQSVIVTALTVFFIMFIVCFLTWRHLLKKTIKTEISKPLQENRILKEFKEIK